MTTTEAADRLAAMFRLFAEHEFAGSSPLYERLAHAAADRPELAAPLLAAPPEQRRALLYFAAIGHLLRTTAAGHRLAQWHPTLGGTRRHDDGDPVAAMAELVDAHRDEIREICATRNTQTNEANRASLLRPAFGRVAELFGGAPLALIEMGTSAGLLLVPDRYAYRYHRNGHHRTYGDGMRLDCELRGESWPAPAGTALTVATRTGIDLAPIPAADPDATAWLHACVWPEHTDRAARLDGALAQVAAAGPVLVAGDLRTAVPPIVAAADPRAVPCVFASHALTYLDGRGRAEVVEMLADLGRSRDMAVIVNEGTRNAHNLFAADVPPVAGGVRTAVTVVVWRGGAASVEVLGEGSAHGTWFDYDPRRYAYRPPVAE